MKNTTCCFFGHRNTQKTEELKLKVKAVAEKLIVENSVDTFFFGSGSKFDNLCLYVVTELKEEKYPHIKRIYVRAEYPYISEEYRNWLLDFYDDTYYPEHMIRAGRAAYVERNYEMINNSEYCIVYYNEQKAPKKRKSGTKIALDYAKKKNRKLVILSN